MNKDTWWKISLFVSALSFTYAAYRHYAGSKLRKLAFLRNANINMHLMKLRKEIPDLLDINGNVHKPMRTPGFNLNEFVRCSNERVIKHTTNILYADEVSSTSTLLDKYFLDVKSGLIFITDRQTKGQGRTGNWDSPLGCLMFSYKFTCDTNNALLVQTIVALSMARAINTMCVHKNVQRLEDIKIKWPNDIYLQDKKIAGFLVNATNQGNTTVMNIGIGINVSNSHPTTSLNNYFGKRFSKEQLLAEFFNEFDSLVEVSEHDNGYLRIIENYKDYWKHLNKKVFMPRAEGHGTIVDLEKDGRIKVLGDDGKEYSIFDRDHIVFLD